MKKQLSFGERRDQSVRTLFGFSVAQNPQLITSNYQGKTSIGMHTTDYIRQKMEEMNVGQKGFYPPYNLLESAIDNTAAILRPCFIQKESKEVNRIISNPMLISLIAAVALRKEHEPDLLRMGQENSMQINPFIDGIASHGCPYAGDAATNTRIDPLFERFVPWSAQLGVASFNNMNF